MYNDAFLIRYNENDDYKYFWMIPGKKSSPSFNTAAEAEEWLKTEKEEENQ